MKKCWVHRLAVLLAVCLLVNNFIEKLPMQVFATAENASVSMGDADNVTDAVDVDKLGTDIAGADTSDTDKLGTDIAGADTSDTDKLGTDIAGADTSDTDKLGADADLDFADADEEGAAGNGETDKADTPTADDNAVGNEELDNAIPPVADTISTGDAGMMQAPLTAAVMSTRANDSGNNLPTTLNEYLTLRDSGVTTFYISTYDEFQAVQNLCAEPGVDGFAGITLILLSSSGETKMNWDMAAQEGFTGIGTEVQPFQGTMECYYGSNGGVQIRLDTPLFAYLGEGATVQKLNLVEQGGCAVIAGKISGKVTISDIALAGSVANDGGSAGIIAGDIAADSQVTVENVRGNGALTVSGAVAGGIAGTLGAGATVTLGEGVTLGSTDAKVTVSGTEAAGGHFGTVTGSCTWDLTEESKLVAAVEGTAAACYAGQFAGRLQQDSSDSNGAALTISDGREAAVDISGTGNGGGLVGFCGNNTKINKPDGTFTITGTVEMTDGSAGGVVGVMKNAVMKLSDYTVDAAVSGAQAGGIVGQIDGGRYIIENAEINGNVEGSSSAGGVAGSVISGTAAAAVELQGSITVTGTPSGGKAGLVVGTQEQALIYYAEVGETGGAQLTASGSLNEIGSYGGIYRNQTMDDGGKLIGGGTLEAVGVINNTVTKSGDDYQLESVADFETLAIALGTDGKFGIVNAGGASIFEGASSHTDLLKASYLVTNSVDISYDKTGIVTLNRNDKDKEDTEYAFSGSMKGSSTDITITQNISVKQDRVGVFSTLGGNASFENLTFAGTIENAAGAGGIAYQSIGTGISLSNIVMQREFENNTGIIGGVLAEERNRKENFTIAAESVTLDSTIKAGKVDKCSGFITTVDNAEIAMNDIVLGGSIICSSNSYTGGFLGRTWDDIGGTIANVTVQSNTAYDVDSTFGCLLLRATNKTGERLTLDTVKLDGLKVTAKSKNNCSLLIQDGTNLVLEVIDYDSTGCTVSNPGSNFDEIVGATKSGSGLSSTGIVSIHSTTEGYFPTYHYENKVEALSGKMNSGSMYFYDVFQRLDSSTGIVKLSSDKVIDSVEEMLLWDILHYAKSGCVWNTFNQNYVETPYAEYKDISSESYTFSGELDLSQISFYPVLNAGGSYIGNNAVISFDASKVHGWILNDSNTQSQHYGLQAGLFYSPSEEITVSDITLTGNVANLGASSGALVSGSMGLQKNGTFENITLDDLWILDYEKGQGGAGLLISNLPGGTVSFDGITMTGYSPESDTKAAAALIGSAGGENVTNLSLDFRKMKIADDKDDRTDGKSHNGNVLAYASFLYNYNYTNDASSNEGHGLYLFSEADNTAKIVTYGEELDFETEFSDNDNKVFAEGTDPDPATIYKPYVYQTKKIEVNPKSGDILKGCGTYEDPYIIETEKQFLTLYRYINETGTDESSYQYKTFYQNWKVIKPGDDSTFCENKHNVKYTGASSENPFSGTGAEDAVIFGNADFPTPDEMSRAYYRLEADIDLSKKMSTTYAQIAADFVGFGTEERPFVGVWYGKGEDGEIHTVTLPKKTVTTPYETYGFIQYAMGAVVKDLVIETYHSQEETSGNQESSMDAGITAKVTTMGGGVIACILGGDNIIDNVTVAVDFAVADESAAIGGYVGEIRKGGLILRNVSDGTDGSKGALANFRLGVVSGDNCQLLSTVSGSSYELLGAVVGKVEDGYVLYEGSTDNYSPLWNGTGGNTLYAQTANYNILNGNYLKDASDGLSVEKGETDTAAITITIPSAAALQVMSMALNADALNVRPSDYTAYKACGYTELSRSRKAAYSNIGCDSADTEDYVSAAKYDNVMNYTQNSYANADSAYAYPYLYDYMGITEDAYLTYLEGGDSAQKGYSILNPAIVIGGVSYIVQWNLAESITYDMSVYGNAFRGLGALYQDGVEYGGSFHGNFDGKNSTIHLEMSRKLLDGEDKKSDSAIANAGLFNVLYGREAALYQVEADFKDIDAAASNVKKCAEIKNIVLTGSISVDVNKKGKETPPNFNIGGIAAKISSGDSRYIFENIVIQDFQATGKDGSTSGSGNVGGIVGYIGTNTNVLIQDCHANGTKDNRLEFMGKNGIGGLVGSAEGAVVLKVENCDGKYLSLSTDDNGSQGVGGLLGYGSSQTKLIFTGTKESPCRVTNSTITGRVSAGGLVGHSQGTLSMCYVSAEELTVGAYRHMGGIVGITESSSDGVIVNAVVKNIKTDEVHLCDIDTYGIGGIVGKNQQNLTIQNAKVTGTLVGDSYQCTLHAGNNKSRTGSSGVGGIVGAHTSKTLNLIECSVDSVSIMTDVLPDNGYSGDKVTVAAGGIVGYVEEAVVLDGTISAENLSVTAPKGYESKQTVTAAGGCFGYVNNAAITGAGTESYSGLTASNNTVTGKQAGGVIGYVSSKNTSVQFTGLTVQNGSVTSDEAAGGVFGYISPSESGSALHGTDVNTNTVQNMEISGRQAGGVIGELAVSGLLRMEKIALTGNTVTADLTSEWAASGTDYSAGGVIGSCSSLSNKEVSVIDITLTGNTIVNQIKAENDAALSADAIDHLAVGGMIGRMYNSGSDSTADNYILCDNLEIKASNKIGVKNAAGDGTTENETAAGGVKLVYGSEGKYQLADVSMPAANDVVAAGDVPLDYEALAQLRSDYGYCVGSIVGVVASDNLQLLLLRSEDADNKFVTPVMDSNPPVTDVGRKSGQSADDYRQYCHIIYGASVDEAKDASKNLADMKAQVDKTKSAYEVTAELTDQQVQDNDNLKALLQEYRLSAEEVALFGKLYQDSYTFSEGMEIPFPVLVYKAEYGTLQEIMECISNVMTNVAGASAADIDESYLSISCQQKLCEVNAAAGGDGNAANITDGQGDASIAAVTENGKTVFTSPRYDGIIDGKLSYTEITFTYGWEDDISGEHKKIFKLPIFVEEPILYNVHMKLMEGKVTDVDTLRESGILESVNNVIMANDSTYTMLLEYGYGKARKNMPDSTSVEKVYSVESDTGKCFAVGTRLMLIDVTGGNKAYYYTVTENNISKLKFTDFKDSAGNPYKNVSINQLEDEKDDGQEYYTDLAGHQLTETGVERFLLTVFAIEDMVEPVVYTMQAGIQIEDEGLASRFDTMQEHEEQVTITVMALPGLEIAFQSEVTATDIAGTIGKDASLTVKASVVLRAHDAYWLEKQKADSVTGIPMIDSSNNGKYLELAFYLRDKSNNRVRFPAGTNFSYKLGDDSYSENRVIANDSVVYYYKDIRDIFEKEDSEYQIGNLTGNTSIDVEFVLDFSGADLSNISEESYDAWLDLLRTPNKDYPMGNGNKLDDYSEEIQANASQELGFAIRAEDLNQLAINTYPTAQKQDTINYHVMFDFGEFLKSATGIGLNALVAKYAGFDYNVTWQVYEKTGTGENVTYKEYNGNDIVMSATVSANGSETKVTSTNGTMTATYQFTEEQLRQGNSQDGEQREGFLSFPGTVTINTQKLTEDDLTKLTNYKIEATLVITERSEEDSSGDASQSEGSDPGDTSQSGGSGAGGTTQSEENNAGTSQLMKETTDFFIYTITRLKTDL